MITTILAILFMISVVGNGLLLCSVKLLERQSKPKEITVRQKAMCDCEHPMSMHDDEGCHQKLIKMQGMTMKNSFKCPCRRYIGPVPMTEYFDDQLKELQ